MSVMYSTVYYSSSNSSRYLIAHESGNSGYAAALKVNLLESKVEDQKNDINNLKQQITELQRS